MSSSRQDYEAIAEILRSEGSDYNARLRWKIAKRIAAYFKVQNETFDEDRFIKACGLDKVRP